MAWGSEGDVVAQGLGELVLEAREGEEGGRGGKEGGVEEGRGVTHQSAHHTKKGDGNFARMPQLRTMP